MARRFLMRLGLLGAILATCQLAAYQAFVSRTLPEEIIRAEEYLHRGVDVIFFGDSTVLEVAPDDTDRRPLYEMLDERLSPREVVPIAHFAYSMPVYSAYCDTFRGASQPPKAVVVPVNLRSFSPGWIYKPEWQFEKEKYLLRNRNALARALFRPLAVFRAIELNPVSQEEYATIPILVGNELIGTAGELCAVTGAPAGGTDIDDFQSKQFACHYQYTLDAANPTLQSTISAAYTLGKMGIPSVFYIVPIDYERGIQLRGESFARQVDANVALIKEALGPTGANVLDLSRSVESSRFCYGVHVHEHLDQQGRDAVASTLGAALDAILVVRAKPRTDSGKGVP